MKLKKKKKDGLENFSKYKKKVENQRNLCSKVPKF